jgi:hypothetical protein
MSVTYGEGVGWATLLAFWTNDLGDDGVDISVSGGGTVTDLVVVAADMIVNGLGVGITQRHGVGIANAIQGVSADPVSFPMPVVPATMGHTADPVDFTQNHTLITVNADQGHTATIAVQGVVLIPVAGAMGHEVAAPSIEHLVVMGAGSATIGSWFQGMRLAQVHNLTAVNATQGNVAGG